MIALSTGVPWLRLATRVSAALSLHEPPRITRPSPLAGPSGSDTGSASYAPNQSWHHSHRLPRLSRGRGAAAALRSSVRALPLQSVSGVRRLWPVGRHRPARRTRHPRGLRVARQRLASHGARLSLRPRLRVAEPCSLRGDRAQGCVFGLVCRDDGVWRQRHLHRAAAPGDDNLPLCRGGRRRRRAALSVGPRGGPRRHLWTANLPHSDSGFSDPEWNSARCAEEWQRRSRETTRGAVWTRWSPCCAIRASHQWKIEADLASALRPQDGCSTTVRPNTVRSALDS